MRVSREGAKAKRSYEELQSMLEVSEQKLRKFELDLKVAREAAITANEEVFHFLTHPTTKRTLKHPTSLSSAHYIFFRFSCKLLLFLPFNSKGWILCRHCPGRTRWEC